MRSQTGIAVAVVIAILGLQPQLLAQWREGPRTGLFGERELGKPLKPRTSQFGGGLERGPSGNFLGRSTADRSTTFQSQRPRGPEEPSLVPPEAYNLEPDMVPGYLEDQARRMEAARQQQLQQLQQLQQMQQPQVSQQQPLPFQQPSQPAFPPAVPVMPGRPDRYLPPAWSTQPAFPQPQPGVPGPTGEDLQNSPDRWFRGAPTPAEQQTPATGSQRYAPTLGLGSAGTLGPSGLTGRSALGRSSAASLGARISQTLAAGALSPIAATILGDTVTLQGSVASAADRQLAERMAAMEPGVRRIDNRIRVEPVPVGP